MMKQQGVRPYLTPLPLVAVLRGRTVLAFSKLAGDKGYSYLGVRTWLSVPAAATWASASLMMFAIARFE